MKICPFTNLNWHLHSEHSWLRMFRECTFTLFPFLSSCNQQYRCVPQFTQRLMCFYSMKLISGIFYPLSKISALTTSKKNLVISKTVSRFFFLMPRNLHGKGSSKKASPPIPGGCEYLQHYHCLCWVLFIFVSRLPLYSLTTFSC